MALSKAVSVAELYISLHILLQLTIRGEERSLLLVGLRGDDGDIVIINTVWFDNVFFGCVDQHLVGRGGLGVVVILIAKSQISNTVGT